MTLLQKLINNIVIDFSNHATLHVLLAVVNIGGVVPRKNFVRFAGLYPMNCCTDIASGHRHA